jgi:hypothetical protein
MQNPPSEDLRSEPEKTCADKSWSIPSSTDVYNLLTNPCVGVTLKRIPESSSWTPHAGAAGVMLGRCDSRTESAHCWSLDVCWYTMYTYAHL